MPPPISDDSDELSELEDQQSGEDEIEGDHEEADINGNEEDTDGPNSSTEDAAVDVADVQEPEVTGKSLHEQLQEAAQEEETDAEYELDEGPPEATDDVEMQSLSAEDMKDEGSEGSDAEDEQDESTDAEESQGESEQQSDTSGAEQGEEDDDDEADSGTRASSSSIEAQGAEYGSCLFCKEPTVNDSGKKIESVLVCTDCNSHAHRECVQQSLVDKADSDVAAWRCPSCVSALVGSGSPKDSRPRSSAPRLVRDLLPVSRGIQRPNSHSIFAQPLISEGEEGGRALRKKKSSTTEPQPMSEKRRRRTTPSAETAGAQAAEESRMEVERAVAHSTRRSSQKSLPTARILQHRPFDKPPPHKFILAFRLEQAKIEKVLDKAPRPGKRRDRRRPPKLPPAPLYHPPVPKFPALPTHHLIFPSIFTDRENEINAKPYGGILSETEADTSRSLPQPKDRETFEIARKEAEEERRKTSATAEAEINGENATIARPNRPVSGPPSKIKCIQFGKFVIDTFYAAPYPEEYSHESRLFICEFCLKYLPSEFVAYRHKLKCPAKHPPGDEIYRDGSISIWEVDGRKKTEYCQCLCLMAKMFLGSKTLYYDVEPFLFYILTEFDEFGYHFVGYFSKEKRPASQNNVSCILVMPIHQRKGYATFLIDFSYLLTRIEEKDGSPEKPLSDMGLTAYRSYWDLTMSRHLLDLRSKPFSTKDLMTRTGMTADDVIHSLERLYAFVRDPVTKTYAVRYDQTLYESIVYDFDSKKHRTLRPDLLVWTPYVMGRSDQAALDAQPMQTIAPREGEIMDDHISTKNANEEEEADRISSHTPRAQSDQPNGEHGHEKDSPPVNEHGVVAPGPPSTEALNTAMSTEIAQEPTTKALVNGHSEASDQPGAAEEQLSGYALANRTHAIPAARFQIDPPIPPSMLRSRSSKKRSHGASRRSRTNDANSPNVPLPVRSSPRHVASVNGSVTGRSRMSSPDKIPGTPVRRSVRKSGLANELAMLDGANDEEDDGDEEEADDEEAKADAGGEEASDESSTSEDGDEDEDEEDSAAEEDGDDEMADPDVEIAEDEDEDDDEEDEEEGEGDVPDDDQVDGDAEEDEDDEDESEDD